MAIKFRTISSIRADDKATWSDAFFLTFDIDWAHDDVLNGTIDLVEEADVAATWFVTHDTPVLERLRSNSKFELGIHPNFNFLLEGDTRNGSTALEVIQRLQAIVSEATAVRSHSLTHSSVLFNLFKKVGLTHEANQFIPYQVGIEVKPWNLWNSLVRVPFIWEDDIHFMCSQHVEMKNIIKSPGLKVVSFHPIHIYLNTEKKHRYESTRHVHQTPKYLAKYRYKGSGTRSLLTDIFKSV